MSSILCYNTMRFPWVIVLWMQFTSGYQLNMEQITSLQNYILKFDDVLIMSSKEITDEILYSLSRHPQLRLITGVDGFLQLKSFGAKQLIISISFDDWLLNYLSTNHSDHIFSIGFWMFPNSKENEIYLKAIKPGSTQLVMTYEITLDNKIIIWSYHSTSKNHEVKMIKLREGFSGAETKIVSELDTLQQRTDLEGLKFHIAAIRHMPLLLLNADDPNQSKGFNKAIFDTLATHLNFTYDFIIPEDNLFGGLIADGNWSGIVGMCYRGEVDLGMPVRRTPLREQYINYSPNIVPFYMSIVTVAQDPKITSILSILHPKGLVALVIMLMFSFILLRQVFRLLNYPGEKVDYSLIAIICFGQFTTQGSDVSFDRHLSYKILILSISLCGLLFSNFFAAQLTSYISVQKPTQQVKSYQDLLDQNVKLFVTHGTAALSEFKTAGASVAQAQIWEKHLSQDNYFTAPTTSLNWERFLSGLNQAILLNHFSFNTYAERDWSIGCGLYQAILPKKYFFTIPYGRNFQYKKLFDISLMKLHEMGLIDLLESHWIYKDSNSFEFVCQKSNLEVEGFGIETTSGLFGLVLSGVAASLVLAGLERLKIVQDQFISPNLRRIRFG